MLLYRIVSSKCSWVLVILGQGGHIDGEAIYKKEKIQEPHQATEVGAYSGQMYMYIAAA